jgi:RNA polymerase sigma factor (sigma-70 family)
MERPTAGGVVTKATKAGPEFEEMFREEYLRLARALYLLINNKDEAEELAQEAMARVYERWDRIRHMESPTGYLYRTALNLSRRRFRGLRRLHPAVNADQADDPTEQVDRRVLMRAAMRGLSLEQREALVLLEWLELTPAEAGGILGVSADAVRARAHRARVALRERLGDGDG